MNRFMSQREIVAGVRSFAVQNYSHKRDGWHILVECWDDDTIIEEMGTARTINGAIKNCRKVTRLLQEVQFG